MFYEYFKIINSEKFSKEIQTTSIFLNYDGMVFNGYSAKLYFSKILSETEKQVLDNAINNHSPIDADLEVKLSIQERKKFGEQFIEDFKLKNLNEGIQWFQAIHMHERIRSWKVIFPPAIGGEANVDLFNMILSGDIETASLSLLYGENDDMSQNKHWVTNERRLWLVNKMRVWLGWPTV